MTLKDHRYKVTILKIERIDEEGKGDFFEGLVYHNMRYDEIVGVQALVEQSNLEDLLVDAGFKNLKANGIEVPPIFKRDSEEEEEGNRRSPNRR